MLLSSLTGLWLWWPLKGSVRRGLHWKRRPDLNSNLHFQAGFWISLPLAVLSLTGVWISFPEVFSGTRSGPSGTAPPSWSKPISRQIKRWRRRGRWRRGELGSIAWPMEGNPAWTVTIRREGKPQEVKVADFDAKASLVPAKPETFARTMRRIHDGTGMPVVWQIIIFVGESCRRFSPRLESLMWLRMRRRRERHRTSMAALSEADALAN